MSEQVVQQTEKTYTAEDYLKLDRKDAGKVRARNPRMLGHRLEREVIVPEAGLDEPDGLENSRHRALRA